MDDIRIGNLYNKVSLKSKEVMDQLLINNEFIKHLDIWKNNVEQVVLEYGYNLNQMFVDFGKDESDYLYQHISDITLQEIHPYNPMIMAMLMKLDISNHINQNYFKQNQECFMFESIPYFWENLVRFENFSLLPMSEVYKRLEFIMIGKNRKYLSSLLIHKHTEEIFSRYDYHMFLEFETKDLWYAVKDGYKPNMAYFERVFRNFEASKLLDKREFADAIFDYNNDNALNDNINQYIDSSIEEQHFKVYFDEIIGNKEFLMYLYSLFY